MGHVEQRRDVEGHHPVPFVERCPERRAQQHHAGVVHHDVEAPVTRRDLGDDRRRRRRVGQVAGHGGGRPAAGGDLGHEVAEPVRPSGGHRDGRPAGGEVDGDRPADPAARARNERHATVESPRVAPVAVAGHRSSDPRIPVRSLPRPPPRPLGAGWEAGTSREDLVLRSAWRDHGTIRRRGRLGGGPATRLPVRLPVRRHPERPHRRSARRRAHPPSLPGRAGGDRDRRRLRSGRRRVRPRGGARRRPAALPASPGRRSPWGWRRATRSPTA